MSRPRLPLTEFERKRLENSRTVAVAALVAGIAAAAILAYLGYVRVAAIAVAVPLVHGLVVLCTPLRRFWLTVLSYGLIPVVAGFVLGFPLFGVLTGVFFVVFLVLGQLRVVRGLGWDTLRILEPTAMEPAAGPYVAAFEALGFERVGAYGHDPAPDRITIVTVLLGPKRDQYASVTDLVLDVTSVFGSRLLLTRNSASTQLPPEYLSSDLRGAEPDELVDAHRRALEVLRMRGLTPDELDPERLVEEQLALEHRVIEWAIHSRTRLAHGLFSSGLGAGELDESPSSARRIEAWRADAAPAL